MHEKADLPSVLAFYLQHPVRFGEKNEVSSNLLSVTLIQKAGNSYSRRPPAVW